MLIVCITITKFKTTPAAKWQESQRWPRGNKREATGEEADQLPKTHSCLAGSVRDSGSSVKTSIHHFWGRGGGWKLSRCYLAITLHTLTACCPAWHGVRRHRESAGCAASLCPSARAAAMLFMSTPASTTSSSSASQNPAAHAQRGTILLAAGMVSAPKLDSYWLW